MADRSARLHPVVTVDCVLLGVADGLVCLVVPGPAGGWRLPGVSPGPAEGLAEAARRALAEQAGIEGGVYLEQLFTFGRPDRVPGGRQISIAHLGLADLSEGRLRSAPEARGARWAEVERVSGLDLDHGSILAAGAERLRGKLRYTPLVFELLPERFSLSELQRIFEAALGQPVDKRNFRRKALASGLLADTGQRQQGVAHRAARLFRFEYRAYRRAVREGRGVSL